MHKVLHFAEIVSYRLKRPRGRFNEIMLNIKLSNKNIFKLKFTFVFHIIFCGLLADKGAPGLQSALDSQPGSMQSA